MSLEDSSIGRTSSVGGTNFEAGFTAREEGSVVVEKVSVPTVLPFILRTRGILKATLVTLRNGHIKVSAPNTTRDKLIRAFETLPGIRLAEFE